MVDVVIIGGGPSGMMAAQMIAENPNVKVTILERLEKIGKKILATGNGKCNYTNMKLSSSNYNNPKFVENTLKIFDNKKLIKYFDSIGMISKELTEGRVYPYTEQANTVLDILRYNLNRLNVNVKSNYEVNNVVYKNGKYLLYNKNQRNYYTEADYVVFACGGCSAQVLGSNGSGYNLVKPFKVKTTLLEPGLVGLKADPKVLAPLNGLRYKCDVHVIEKKTKKNCYSNRGEVQFKEDGVSGIVIMEVSSYLKRHVGNYYLSLDLLPQYSVEDLIIKINDRKKIFLNNECQLFLTGLLPKMLGTTVVKMANINLTSYVKDLNNRSIKKIAMIIKDFPLEIKGDYGFDKSQVTIGGIALNEIEVMTLKLKKMDHAYIVGEMMDIDGDCGGYNLQWAFTSGYIAGKAILDDIKMAEKPKKKTVKNNDEK